MRSQDGKCCLPQLACCLGVSAQVCAVGWCFHGSTPTNTCSTPTVQYLPDLEIHLINNFMFDESRQQVGISFK